MPKDHVLEQFRGQLYRALYVDGFSLAEFVSAMDGVFKAVQAITFIRIESNLDSWRSRKKRLDKEWDVKNGGPSPDVRSELLNQRTWFFKGIDGKVAYKPFELEGLTLSKLPKGFSIATDSKSPDLRSEMDHIMGDDSGDGQGTEIPTYEARPDETPTSLQDFWPSTWSLETAVDAEDRTSDFTHFRQNLSPLIENTSVAPSQLIRAQYSPVVPQQQHLSYSAWNAPCSRPSYKPPLPCTPKIHHHHTLPSPSLQKTGATITGVTGNIGPQIMGATNHDGHAIKSAWSASFQPN